MILCFRPKYYIEEVKTNYKVNMYLNIQNLDMNDLGSYTCLASNSLGQANSSVRVHSEFNNQVDIIFYLSTKLCYRNHQSNIVLRKI